VPLSTSLKLVRMGATESTHKVPVHCSSDVAVLTEKDPTYIPGTNLPVDGWLHPCVCCTTTTARIVKRPGEGLQFLCRRCDNQVATERLRSGGLSSSKRSTSMGMLSGWMDVAGDPTDQFHQSLGMDEFQILEDITDAPMISLNLKAKHIVHDRNDSLQRSRCPTRAVSHASTYDSDRSKVDWEMGMHNADLCASEGFQDSVEVDLLCHAVVAEMLMGENPLLGVLGVCGKDVNDRFMGTKEDSESNPYDFQPRSPLGICEGADVWSDIDSGGSSPRQKFANKTDASMASTSTPEESIESATFSKAADVHQQLSSQDLESTPKKEIWTSPSSPQSWVDRVDTLYPHDIWHWNMHSATGLYV